MSIQEPPQAPVNLIGLTRNDYKGLPSTLCKGCGHDSISAHIISVAYDLSINPTQLIKLSGIGCSSKTPAYFLQPVARLQRPAWAHALGRRPARCSPTTRPQAIGVSGDGDTGSIGIGQFKHLVRRNVPMVYIVENNGVYGLTKGQFSATADEGQELKYAGHERAAADRPVPGGADRRLRLRRALLRGRRQAGARRCSRPRSAIAARRCSTSSARASPSTTSPTRPRATPGARSTRRRSPT